MNKNDSENITSLIKQPSNLMIWGILTLIVFSFWKLDVSFFWREDWTLLTEFQSFNFAYLFEPYAGYYQPVFKLFYFLELQIFGVNAVLYIYINLLLHALTGYYFYKILNCLFEDKIFPLLIAVLFCIHPLNFNHLLWISQVGEILQLLFQTFTVYHLIQYLQSPQSKSFTWLLLGLIIQNFTYDNGLFFPLLPIIALFIFDESTQKNNHLRLLGIIQVIFLGVQFGTIDFVGEMNSFTDWGYAYLYQTGANISRAFLLIYSLKGVFLGWIFLTIMVLSSIILLRNNPTVKNRQGMILSLLWGGISGLGLSINYFSSIIAKNISYYQSVVALLPVLLGLAVLIYPFYKYLTAKNNSLVAYGLGTVFLVVFILNQRLANTFELRGVRNHLAMNQAIENKQSYAPFDDPYFGLTPKWSYDLTAKEVYLYWKAKTKILMTNEKLLIPGSVIDNKSYRTK